MVNFGSGNSEIPNVTEDRIPESSQLRATWEQREQVLAILQRSDYLKAWFANPVASGLPLKSEEMYELYVLRHNAPGPRALVFRPGNSAPYAMADEFQENLARQILEIVAPAGIEPLQNWAICWPRDRNKEEFRETLPFLP
jgi:hypothetical protein